MNLRLLTPLLLAAGFVAFALMGGATAQDKDTDDAKIAKLIEQLGDDDFDVRKAAEKKLIEIGEPAFVQVKRAARKAADADVKLRAIVLEGSALASQGGRLSVVAAWGLLSFVVGLRLFRWN